MTRTPSTSMYSAVLLSFLLVVVVGTPMQPAGNIQDPLKKLHPVGATGADLVSHEHANGVTSLNDGRVESSKEFSWHPYSLQFKPPATVKFLHQLPLSRHFPELFANHKNDASLKGEPGPDELDSPEFKQQKPSRQKRSAYSNFKVPCWEKAGGCEVPPPATEAANFSQDCQNLLSRCSMWLDTVERIDKSSNLKCGRTVNVDNDGPEAQPVATEKDNTRVVALGKNVERPVGELDAKLAQLSMELDSQKNKLVDLGQQLNHLHDALQEKFAAAAASTLRYLEGNAREVKALLNEKTESMMTTMSSVLSMVVINPKAHRWNFTGYAGHKADAIKKGWFWELGAKVYLQRYLLYWGIEMKAKDGDVSLYLLFQLHKGTNDEFLDWPFSNKLNLCLIHPETQREHCTSYQPDIAAVNNKFFARPLKDSNERVYFPSTKIDSSYAEKNGYMKEDKLLLKLDVLS